MQRQTLPSGDLARGKVEFWRGGAGAQEQEQEQQQTDGDGESKDGDGKGGEYQDSNKVIDGDQYYGDRLEEYLALAEEILENDGEIPDDLREFIESYYGTIE